MNKFVKYFCYPLHFLLYLTRNIERYEIKTILVLSLWFIPTLLVTVFVNNSFGMASFIYLFISLRLYNPSNYDPEDTNVEDDENINRLEYYRSAEDEYDNALSALTQDFYNPPRYISFSSHIIPFSNALENSVGWLSIEKNHPIHVFGIENELIVVTEYFGNEIGKIVLDAVNDVEQFVDVECFKLRRNDKRKLACRFVPIGEDDYKIEYLRIRSDKIEVIGVDE